MKKISLFVVLFALVVSANVVSAIESCPLTTLVSSEVSPDKTSYSEKETVTAVVKIKNNIMYEKTAYTLSLYTGMNIVGTWSCSRDDDQPCVPTVVDAQTSTVSIAPISTVIGNTSIYGDMPETITISITGKTPSIKKTTPISLIRIRQERDSCEVANLRRSVSSGNISDVDSCLSTASAKLSNAELEMYTAKKAGCDVTNAQTQFSNAQIFYNNANDTYDSEGVTSKNKASIMSNCNSAYQSGSDIIEGIKSCYSNQGFWGFIYRDDCASGADNCCNTVPLHVPQERKVGQALVRTLMKIAECKVQNFCHFAFFNLHFALITNVYKR